MVRAADKGHGKVASAMGKWHGARGMRDGREGHGGRGEVVVRGCKGHREMVLGDRELSELDSAWKRLRTLISSSLEA